MLRSEFISTASPASILVSQQTATARRVRNADIDIAEKWREGRLAFQATYHQQPVYSDRPGARFTKYLNRSLTIISR